MRNALFHNTENIFFAHHQQLFAVGFNGLTAVFAENHFVADFDIQRTARAVFTDFALLDKVAGMPNVVLKMQGEDLSQAGWILMSVPR